MGWLSSCFQSQMLTHLISQENNKVTHYMSRITSIKKESSQLEKQITRELNNAKTAARNDYTQSLQSLANTATQQMVAAGFDPTKLASDATAQLNYNQIFTQLKSQAQTTMENAITQAEQAAEDAKEMQLQPLEDEGTDLEVRKAHAEDQVKLYTQWKEGVDSSKQNQLQALRPGGANGRA